MEWYDTPKKGKVYLRYAKMGLCEIPVDVGGVITFPNGMYVGAGSPRMKLLWGRKELICNVCGLAAGFAAIEAHPNCPESVHLNFYSYDVNGAEVMMTWDHVVPKAEGGDNTQQNAQCLCETCNHLKGAAPVYKPSEIQKLRKEKGLPIRYIYFADGSRVFQWSKRQFTTTLNGKSIDTDSGNTYKLN